MSDVYDELAEALLDSDQLTGWGDLTQHPTKQSLLDGVAHILRTALAVEPVDKPDKSGWWWVRHYSNKKNWFSLHVMSDFTVGDEHVNNLIVRGFTEWTPNTPPQTKGE